MNILNWIKKIIKEDTSGDTEYDEGDMIEAEEFLENKLKPHIEKSKNQSVENFLKISENNSDLYLTLSKRFNELRILLKHEGLRLINEENYFLISW